MQDSGANLLTLQQMKLAVKQQQKYVNWGTLMTFYIHRKITFTERYKPKLQNLLSEEP